MALTVVRTTSGLFASGRASGKRGKGRDALGRWSRHWARPGRRGRRPRRGSSRPRHRARRSGAPLPAWRAGWRRARHAGSAARSPLAAAWRASSPRRSASSPSGTPPAMARGALKQTLDGQGRKLRVEVTWLKGRRRSARRGQTVETSEAVDQFVEVVFAERISFEHASSRSRGRARRSGARTRRFRRRSFHRASCSAKRPSRKSISLEPRCVARHSARRRRMPRSLPDMIKLSSAAARGLERARQACQGVRADHAVAMRDRTCACRSRRPCDPPG